MPEEETKPMISMLDAPELTIEEENNKFKLKVKYKSGDESYSQMIDDKIKANSFKKYIKDFSDTRTNVRITSVLLITLYTAFTTKKSVDTKPGIEDTKSIPLKKSMKHKIKQNATYEVETMCESCLFVFKDKSEASTFSTLLDVFYGDGDNPDSVLFDKLDHDTVHEILSELSRKLNTADISLITDIKDGN